MYLYSGNATISSDGVYLFVSNLVNGVDQYRFPTMEQVNTYPHPILRNFPLQVSTASHEGLWMVCGGDDGFVRLYGQRTGQHMNRLLHSEGVYYPSNYSHIFLIFEYVVGTLVQAVTVRREVLSH